MGTYRMRKDVQARIRSRIRARLEELDMTARELARAVGHGDAWISGILKGSQGIDWKDFDAIAEKLNLPPSELVRMDESELRELSPTEMRLHRYYQLWPAAVQQKWADILDHFHVSAPDRETATLLDRLRTTPRGMRRPLLGWLTRLLEEGIPLEVVTGGVELDADASAAEPSTTHQTQTADQNRRGTRGERGRRRGESTETP
jgi:transcriptional regulator with XRE-family HTH domain